MPKYPLTYRLARVLRFLSALRDPGVAARLAQRGFDEAEAERGWRYLDAASGRHMAMQFPADLPDMSFGEVLDRIGEWYRVAYDVADATLRHEYPQIHEQVFADLTKARGTKGLLHAKLLMGRLEQLARSDDPTRAEALALLAKRGLDRDQLDEGEELVGGDNTVGRPPPPEGYVEAERQRQAHEVALWDWYLAWSQIARTVVESKRLRIRMGISQMGRSGTAAPEDEPEDEDEPEPVVVG
jgi:hypothetical protein